MVVDICLGVGNFPIPRTEVVAREVRSAPSWICCFTLWGFLASPFERVSSRMRLSPASGVGVVPVNLRRMFMIVVWSERGGATCRELVTGTSLQQALRALWLQLASGCRV